MPRPFVSGVFCLALLAGCGDDDVVATDASTGIDASMSADAGAGIDAMISPDAAATDAGPDLDAASEVDASEADASEADASEADASTDSDAAIDAGTTIDAGTDSGAAADAGAACHAHDFGAPAVAFRHVSSLPEYTGGVIPLGTYDAVDVQTTGSLNGSYRATWVFEDATNLSIIQQVTISAAGPIVPRSYTYSTVSTTLARAEVCPDRTPFSNQYSVREEGGVTYLDVGQGPLLFTFRRR